MSRSLFLALVLAATTAAAELPQLSFTAGWNTQVFAAREYDLVATTDGLSLGRVGLSAGLPLRFGLLELEAAYLAGDTGSFAHGAIPVAFALKEAQLGLAWRVPIFSWLQPYVQLAGGLDWATLTLMSQARLTQTVLTGAGTALLGVQLAVRLGPRGAHRLPALVFDFGAGGVLRPTTRFDAMAPVRAAQDDALGRGTVALGGLPLSGFTARLQLGLRY